MDWCNSRNKLQGMMLILFLFALLRLGLGQHLPVGLLQFWPSGSPSFPSGDASTIIHRSLDNAQQILVQAMTENPDLQLFVFPEAAFGFVAAERIGTRDAMLPYCESFQMGDQLCSTESSTPQISTLSCLASKFQVAIIASVCQLVPCTNCSDGRYQLSVGVTIDQTGAITQIYRKIHLFDGEDTVFDQPTSVPSDPTLLSGPVVELSLLVQPARQFQTVRLFTMICFDIEFAQPISQLNASDIDSIVVMSWWPNQQPQYGFTAIAQGWSAAHQLPLLASAATEFPAMFGSSDAFVSGVPLSSTYIPAPPSADQIARGVVSVRLPLNPSLTGETVASFRIDAERYELTDGFPCQLASFPTPGRCVLLPGSSLLWNLSTLMLPHSSQMAALDMRSQSETSPAKL